GSSPAKQITVFAHERPGTCDRAASCCAPKAASWRNAVKGTCDFLRNSSRDRGLTGPPAARGQLATASPTNEENDAISGDGRQYSGGAARWRRNLAQSIHDPKKPRSAPTTADAAGDRRRISCDAPERAVECRHLTETALKPRASGGIHMAVRPRYPGIRITANGNQLVSYHTETRIADGGIFYPITP